MARSVGDGADARLDMGRVVYRIKLRLLLKPPSWAVERWEWSRSDGVPQPRDEGVLEFLHDLVALRDR